MSGAASSSPARGMPQPGETIDGKYALIRVIGTGGMGVVYEAEHLRLKQRCAIKMLSAEMLREADIIHRFEREARASALLKSPHVTRVTDVATTPQGVPYIVMELLTGHDLDGELQATGRLRFPEAVDYVLQACAAVAEAHAAGIIHRDLKPGNLFLAEGPDGVMVKVLDFGISKMIDEDSKLTRAGTTMGTALYMSPEQLRSAAKVDARSDIWSLGVILYELLCGETPFAGPTTHIAAAIVSEDAPDICQRCAIPPELGAVIHRTLRRPPAERFATVTDLMTALLPFAPADGLGVAVAAQIARRGSSRNLQPISLPPSSADFASADQGSAPTIARDVLTLARDVSTSAAHEVNPSARPDSSSRKRLFAALAMVAVIAVLGLGLVAFKVLRERPTAAHPPAAGVATSGAPLAAESDTPESKTTAAAAGTGAPPKPSDTAGPAAGPRTGPGATGTTAAAPLRPARPTSTAAATTAPSSPARAPATARPAVPAPTAPQFL